jgi:CO/xanthine dehydrogenase Mo-binding subunit
MLVARVPRPPVPGAQVRSVDLGDVRGWPGLRVVQDGAFVAVAGQDRDLVEDALTAIQVDWDVPEPAPIPDVERHLRDHPVHRQGWGGNVHDVVGGPEEIFSRAPLQVSASYRTAFLAHVPLETRSTVVEWERGRLTAWTGTQVPFGVRAQVAAALQLPESAVRIVVRPAAVIEVQAAR